MCMFECTCPCHTVHVLKLKLTSVHHFVQTGNNNSTKTLLPVRRRCRTRAREWERERARPLRSVTCWTCAGIGVRTRLTSRCIKSNRKKPTPETVIGLQIKISFRIEFCLNYAINICNYIKFKNSKLRTLQRLKQKTVIFVLFKKNISKSMFESQGRLNVSTS